MERLSIKQREKSLRRMADEGVDILVIGGGITGAGVAVDAAARGYRVGLVDKGDFAGGTSSKSTKLVHGGIRYLPQFDFALVHEALVERGLLTRNAPFLVQPLAFVLPLYKENKKPLGTPIVPPGGIGMGYVLRMGLMTYDTLAGRLGVGKHRHISTERARRILPCLRPEGLIDAFIYYDAQTDDTRLTDTVIRTAADHGARIANYSEVIAFDQDDGRIKRVVVRDCETGDEYVIRAGTVVNAGGVFAGRIEEMAGTDSKVTIKPAKGIHLTVPREKLKMNKAALVLPETEDGRLLFLVPWGPRVTIGTTDTKGGNIDHPVADEEDIEYLLRHVNHYMNCDLTRADVISAWAGYRPLVSTKHEESATSKLSRSHVVVDGPGGMVTVTGGKLTTYRRMAQDTLDHIAKRQGKAPSHVTEHLPLAGSVGWQVAIEELKADAPKYGLGPDTVTRLSTYGSTVRQIMDLLEEDSTLSARIVKDLPYIMAEVVFACRYEMAVHLTDVLERRLHINFEDWDRGYEVAPAVAEVMARELGWDTDKIGHEIENYRQDVRSEQPIPQDGPVDSSEDLSGYVRETTPRT